MVAHFTITAILPYTALAGSWKNMQEKNCFTYRRCKWICYQRNAYPEEKLGIIVFTNTDQNTFYEALKWEILDAYLGFPYRNYSKVYLNFQQNAEPGIGAERTKNERLRSTSFKTRPAH